MQARVVCALVSVAFGALDAAHNAVTPLSWGAPTEFAGVSAGAGRSVHNAYCCS